MALHEATFDYLQPTLEQVTRMQTARLAARDYAHAIEHLVPDGPDKTYILRKLREVAMWVNVAITRNPDGSPRQERGVDPKDYPADHPVKGDLGSIPL
jgi:hypothetical protein